MGDTDIWTVVTIVGMALITVLTRSFFFLSSKPWTMPAWVQRGLQFAPVAAIAAVVLPEIVTTQGHLITTWQDARLFGLLAGTAWFYRRRGVLGTILAGMAVYLPLRLGLGW